MESGNPINYNSFQTTAVYQPAYDEIVRQTGCATSVDTLDCLRSTPFESLNDLLNGSGTYWQPVVDGDFIARWTSVQLDEGAFVRVPVIAGATTDEGTLWAKKGINTSAEFKQYATSNTTLAYLPPQFGDEILQAYPNEPAYWSPSVSEVPIDAVFPPDSGAQYRRNAAYETDFAIVALRRSTCEAWARWSVPAYCYRFNTQPAGIPYWMGVPHFSEVAFVFDNTDGLGYDKLHESVNPFANKPIAYQELAKKMSRTWASFIHDGSPSVDGVVWDRYDLDHPRNLVWDANKTQLVYLEPDTFRADGIRFILDQSLNYHR